jgi:acetyltransferase
MSIRHLDSLFDPRSVAVIGASERPASVGGTVWNNLRHGAFRGTTYAVNPKYRQLGGEPVFSTVADLPSVPELAVICTPPGTVAGLINELGERGTRAAIVLRPGSTRRNGKRCCSRLGAICCASWGRIVWACWRRTLA